MEKPIIIYYHVYMVNNWFDIVKDQIDYLKQSNLFSKAKIRVGLSYPEIECEDQKKLASDFFNQYENVEILFLKLNGCAESETLIYLKNYSDETKEDAHILYIHTKGVTQFQTVKETPVTKWRKIMEYFLIEYWENCIKKLNEGYDCCGINYQQHTGTIKNVIRSTKIFNGNFFWTKPEYVKKLDKDILFEHRYSAENWLLSQDDHKAFSFFDIPPNVNLYCPFDIDYKYKT